MGRGFSNQELWSETRFLLVAGTDTTSNVMTALFYYLSQYPECYEKLADEVWGSFRTTTEMCSGPAMAQCTYLRACIDEALRMSPPVGGALWREVREGGLVVDGQFVPEGYDVGCSIYCLHHNEECYPNSFVFNPDRWIVSETNSREAVERARQAFVPFSVGTRSCAGRNFAYMEVSNTIAQVLWRFDFKAASKTLQHQDGVWGKFGVKSRRDKAEFPTRNQITSVHDGPYLKFRPR